MTTIQEPIVQDDQAPPLETEGAPEPIADEVAEPETEDQPLELTELVADHDASDDPPAAESADAAPAQPAPNPEPDLKDRLADIHKEIRALKNDFEANILKNRDKDAIIARLNAEIQDYKQDLTFKIAQPLLMEVIRLIDVIGGQAAYFRSKEDLPALDAVKFLEGLPLDLEEMLNQYRVEAFASDTDDFNPARQKVVKKITTGQAELDRKVARRLGPGYEANGRQLRLELVEVYTYDPGLDPDRRPEAESPTEPESDS